MVSLTRTFIKILALQMYRSCTEFYASLTCRSLPIDPKSISTIRGGYISSTARLIRQIGRQTAIKAALIWNLTAGFPVLGLG
jgi:hypothetical protein